jgi:HK97 family phage prohead protease
MKFTLSDESVNIYGFRVLTNGIELSDFLKNPVMFWNHDSSLMPIGKWKKVTVENGRLTGEPELYNGRDPLVAKIRGLLEQGIINATSIGFEVLETSDDAHLMFPGQVKDTVTKSRLLEVSLVGIPGNANATRHNSLSGKVTLSHHKGSIYYLNNKKNVMELTTRLIELLGLPADATDDQIFNTVKSLKEDQKSLKEDQKEAVLDAALSLGKITKDEKLFYLKLNTDVKELKKHMDAKPATKSDQHITLSDLVKELTYTLPGAGSRSNSSNNSSSNIKPQSEWTLTDYRKHAPNLLRKNPELYKQLIEKEG